MGRAGDPVGGGIMDDEHKELEKAYDAVSNEPAMLNRELYT